MDEETAGLPSIQEANSFSMQDLSREEEATEDNDRAALAVDSLRRSVSPSMEQLTSPPPHTSSNMRSASPVVFQDEYSPSLLSTASEREKQHRLSVVTTTNHSNFDDINSNTPMSSLGGSGAKVPRSGAFEGPAYTPASGRYIMSDASRMFDRDGKGYLDSTERALRTMDKDNDGQLGLNEMYAVMKSFQEEQRKSHEFMVNFEKEHKKAVHLKYGVVGLVIFAVLLSVANIGTAFVAASLAKDTSISSYSGDLVNKDTNVRVGTTNKNIEFTAQPISEEVRRRLGDVVRSRRRLQMSEMDDDRALNELTCGNSFLWTDANGMQQQIRQCTAEAIVSFRVAVEMYRSFCPLWQPQARIPGLAQQPPNPCPSVNGGVNHFYLTCNGLTNRIFDTGFPRGGPFQYSVSNTLFPGLDNSTGNATYPLYEADQIGFDPMEDPALCFQPFSLGIFCDEESLDDACVLFKVLHNPRCPWYQPGLNATRSFSVCGGQV